MLFGFTVLACKIQHIVCFTHYNAPFTFRVVCQKL
jgi:hypothetical protein